MILYFRPCYLVARSSVKVKYHHPKTLHVRNAKTWRFCEAVLTLLIYYYVLFHKLSVKKFCPTLQIIPIMTKCPQNFKKDSCSIVYTFPVCSRHRAQLIPSQSKYVWSSLQSIWILQVGFQEMSIDIRIYLSKCENRLLLELTASDMNSRWP